MKHAVVQASAALLIVISAFSLAQGRDSLIVGSANIDTIANSAFIPLFATTNDSVQFILIPLRISASSGDARFSGLEYFYPITVWDMRYDSIMSGGAEIRILSFASSDPDPSRPSIFTNNQRQNIITLEIAFDSGMPPQQIMIDSLQTVVMGESTVFIPGFINYNPVSIDNGPPLLPDNLLLMQNYPNPFNAQTIIQYYLPANVDVTISVFDILGRKIEALVDGYQDAGYHQVVWNAAGNPSGLYFYCIRADNFSQTNRALIIR